ncbi:MAG: InlB B-repeat-containing protein [Bacteroidales bacterium]|nr:InlB B-repeat-containing protein [Bacteroidales bacterium]
MRTLSKYVLIVVLTTVLFLFGGCVEDNLTKVELQHCDHISFSASITADTRSDAGEGFSSYLSIREEEWPLTSYSAETKATTINSLEGLSVGMYAHTYTSSTWGSRVMDGNLYKFINKEVMEAEDELVYWDNTTVSSSDVLRVYGYAPYDLGTNAVIANKDDSTTITYTVPESVADQKDIIATDIKEVPSDYQQNIPLTFQHILTGIRFKAGFACTVKSLKVEGVNNSGIYTIGDVWKNQSGTQSFTLPIPSAGKSCAEGGYITGEDEILMMIPQQLPSGAKVVMTYSDGSGDATISASLEGMKWESGAMITYTLHKDRQEDYVYFDLYAGNVSITPTSYSGYVFVNGTVRNISKSWDPAEISENDYHYYVYQSTEANKSQYGYENEAAFTNGICRIPKYEPVKVGNKLWSDYITNNQSVEDVIEMWDDGKYIRSDGADAPNEQHIGIAAVRDVGRTHTKNYIKITGEGATNYKLTIDNIYSVIQQSENRNRTKGGISYIPKGNTTLTVNLLGDNRMGCLHIDTNKSDKIIFEGTGSLTVANTDFLTKYYTGPGGDNYYGSTEPGYISNHRNSAIGNNTGGDGHMYGLYINSGVIFAGTTKVENSSALGGGGNGYGQVFINGGKVTAVATTTGTAIGGGIGFTDVGGPGEVHITGGSIYAYNFATRWGIPSSAIGGGGSRLNIGKEGTVNISGGYVYAFSALGTAIGGGSSQTKEGGSADITITGGHIIARSDVSASIGGGTGGTGKASNGSPAYGGSAIIKISGNPTIRTGSVGGGKTNNPSGKIGHADITVQGGDISAQFVMAGGADVNKKSSFKMNGGVISSSDVDNKEFFHVVKNGGAVYMEDGNFEMTAGTITECSAEEGGAVYIAKSSNAIDIPTFNMSGGSIQNCESESNGGAVSLKVGEVTMTGGKITENLARNGNGGGIYIEAGDFMMSGSAEVSNNSALHRSQAISNTGNGGGIYVTSSTGSVNVTVNSGKVQYNSCDQKGGGICVDMSESDASVAAAIIKIGNGITGPDIINNKAVLYGGGLYAEGVNAEITIDGGSIKNNRTANYVPNEDVANEKGTVILEDGDVTHVEVIFDLNTTDPTATVTPSVQKIVTATNSFLVAPTPTRSMYNFVGWNSRKDGMGTTYTTGSPMNLKENLTLYAQWQSQ